MSKPTYDELWLKYCDALETITELNDKLKDCEMDIMILEAGIADLEDILYENGIFKHFDFN